MEDNRNEKKVIVKESQIIVRLGLIVLGVVTLGFSIFILCAATPEEMDELRIALIIILAISISSFVLAIFVTKLYKRFTRTTQIYTATNMIKKRGKKILFEVEWDNVATINYNKLCFLSVIFFSSSFGPTSFMIFQKVPPKNKKQPKVLLAHYTLEEVKQIQSVIPIEIKML